MIVYVGTPFTKFRGGLDAAYRVAVTVTARLTAAGIAAYSPIVHTYPLSTAGAPDYLDHDFWLAADVPFMDAAGALLIVKAEGWDESYGIAIEARHFRKAHKPVVHATPEEIAHPDFPQWLRQRLDAKAREMAA